MTHALVVMGPSGAGKSTLGCALAAALGWRFVEGDTLHPPANIAKMSAGIPLEDVDRWPFLEAVAGALSDSQASGVVMSCSALKRRYRQLLRNRVGQVTFVLPQLDREQLVARALQRTDHFMPASLLESQLADFEKPESDECVVIVDGSAALEDQCAAVLAALATIFERS